MPDDTAKLVALARHGWPPPVDLDALLLALADALERLTAERDEARADLAAAMQEIVVAEDDRDRLAPAWDGHVILGQADWDDLCRRVEIAEAERDRLADALNRILRLVKQIADAALAGTAAEEA